jgi:hypothetical protein
MIPLTEAHMCIHLTESEVSGTFETATIRPFYMIQDILNQHDWTVEKCESAGSLIYLKAQMSKEERDRIFLMLTGREL